MYEQFGIKKEIEDLGFKVENEIKEQFDSIDRICEINSLKVLKIQLFDFKTCQHWLLK